MHASCPLLCSSMAHQRPPECQTNRQVDDSPLLLKTIVHGTVRRVHKYPRMQAFMACKLLLSALTSIGSASMSALSAILGLPLPTVATIPVTAYGCLNGMPSSFRIFLSEHKCHPISQAGHIKSFQNLCSQVMYSSTQKCKWLHSCALS